MSGAPEDAGKAAAAADAAKAADATDAAQVIDWEALGQAALAVRERAHAPYSGYRVGAAILVRSGRVFAGCNVENASYGLAICAERSAIVQMVAAGERDPIALAVATGGPVLGSPCGMCRQTLAEFAVDLPIRLVAPGDVGVPPRTTSLAALLPDAFGAAALAR
ncbi:cytidine deaminase [Sorangium sp. So ce1024]|uniref:cytidine deaminase n=1 Tax=unclassified Sorangium TaxID=2621164 RepID=UPI003F02E022